LSGLGVKDYNYIQLEEIILMIPDQCM